MFLFFYRWLVVFSLVGLVGCTKQPAATPKPTATAEVVKVTPTPDVAVGTPTPTPSELSLSEAESMITRRYKDYGFAVMTEDRKTALEILSDSYIDSDGKSLSKADHGKNFDKDIAFRREVDKIAGESLRFSLQNDIIQITREGPNRVACKVRFTQRMRTQDGIWAQTYVGENVDYWRLESDGKWRMCQNKPDKMISHTRVIDGQTEKLPKP